MQPKDIAKLRALTSFPALVAYLRDELDWPVEVEDADDITFDYDPAELGIDPRHAAKIERIKQVRPLVDSQSPSNEFDGCHGKRVGNTFRQRHNTFLTCFWYQAANSFVAG